MNKFDIEAAVERICETPANGDAAAALEDITRAELRAAVLAGREEVIRMVVDLGNDPMNDVSPIIAHVIVTNAARLLPKP